MVSVLAKRWLTQGWRILGPDDSEVMALAWIELLDQDRVPYQHYEELYRRAVDLRSRRLSQGLRCDDFSAELMLACWPGLARELEQKRIDERRYLPDTAASDCPKCFGSNMEVVPGKGARVCKH
jgi:hypothetical protein